MPGPRILLVEDEALIRVIFAEAIAEEGFEVIEAPSGEAGLAKLNGLEPVDLLVTDMQLPGGMDGATLARQLRRLHPQSAVMYMTGRPEAFARIASLGPRDDLVAKPLGVTELLRRIRLLLAADK